MITTARNKLIRGFTLVELLIVIAILGILAAAVLIAINPTKRQNQAKDSNIKSDIGSTATALQAYYTAPGNGQYPTLAQGTNELVVNQDLKSVPVPPAGAGAAYGYAVVPVACDNVATPCIDAALWAPMFEKPQNSPGGSTAAPYWCWQSKTGRAQVMRVPDTGAGAVDPCNP